MADDPAPPRESAGDPGRDPFGAAERDGEYPPERGRAPEPRAPDPPWPEPDPDQALPPLPLGPSLPPAPRLPPPPVPPRPELRWIDLSTIVETDAHRFREPEAVAALAESIARYGQRDPVDLRPVPGGQQLLAGHRRLAAIRLLHRTRILARVHEGLAGDDALLLALEDDLDRRAYSAAERAALAVRLEAEGRLGARAASLLARAEAQAHPEPAPEGAAPSEAEVEIDELAGAVRDRLADASNDLALLFESWADLDEGRREDLVECVRYLHDLFPFIAPDAEDET